MPTPSLLHVTRTRQVSGTASMGNIERCASRCREFSRQERDFQHVISMPASLCAREHGLYDIVRARTFFSLSCMVPSCNLPILLWHNPWHVLCISQGSMAWNSFRISMVIILLMLCTQAAYAYGVSISWNGNTENDLEGYKVYYGTSTHTYHDVIDVGLFTSAVIDGLSAGVT